MNIINSTLVDINIIDPLVTRPAMIMKRKRLLIALLVLHICEKGESGGPCASVRCFSCSAEVAPLSSVAMAKYTSDDHHHPWLTCFLHLQMWRHKTALV